MNGDVSRDESSGRHGDRTAIFVVYEDYARDSRVRRHARVLAQQGFSVRVLGVGGDAARAAARADGVELDALVGVKYRGPSLLRYLIAYAVFGLRALTAISRAVMRRRPRLVWVNNPPDPLVFAAVPARLRNVPLVLDVHDMTSDLFAAKFKMHRLNSLLNGLVRELETASYRFADGLVTVHEGYAERISARVNRPVISVLNAPDQEQWMEIGDQRVREPAKVGSLVLGHHGTIVERFGVDLLLRAVAELRTRGMMVRLRLLGEGDFADRVEELIDELRIGDVVYFDRRVFAPEDVAAFAAAIDVGVAPYRPSRFLEDAVPVKVLEYVTLGVPVIVTPTTALRRLLPPDAVRYLPQVTTEALVEAIIDLSDPERRKLYAEATRSAARRFAWRHERERLERWLEQLVEGSDRSTAWPTSAES